MRAPTRVVATVCIAAVLAVMAGCGQKGPLIPLKDAGDRSLPATTSSPMSSSTSTIGTAGSASTSSPSTTGGASSSPASSAKP